MSVTATYHCECDVCGKRQDMDDDRRAFDFAPIPDGWRRIRMVPPGLTLVCSLDCARVVLHKQAEYEAESLFAVPVPA